MQLLTNTFSSLDTGWFKSVQIRVNIADFELQYETPIEDCDKVLENMTNKESILRCNLIIVIIESLYNKLYMQQ